MALQDELNTRLSDRANRVTLQSFKMYLGKGIEGFENRQVAPGRMWSTENPDAKIEEFGGDEGSPSEEAHLRNIRDALEKASGVGSVRFRRLLDAFGTPERIARATRGELKGIEGIGNVTAGQVYEGLNPVDPDRELELAERPGVQIIHMQCDESP